MRNLLVWGIVIAVVIAGIGLYKGVIASSGKDLAPLAQCLADKGVLFYGAYWCPHCQAQKKMFGTAAKYLPYVECAQRGSDEMNQVCKDANIEGFPTWVFPSGQRVTGEQQPDRLAQLGGCA